MQQPDGRVPAAHEARGSLHERHAGHRHVLPARHQGDRQHGHRVGFGPRAAWTADRRAAGRFW
eukprot:15976764-Heterocapsa_arctica.AAC.1